MQFIELSPQQRFTIIQKKLDDIGFITSINRIITNKRYEVIVNGELKKQYKMSRYISKLPPEIRELAERRRIEQNPKCKEDLLSIAFHWFITPERDDFWRQIANENYAVFYEKYPQDDCTEECEKEKDKLDELIEWMEQAVESCKIQESSFRESEMENAASFSGAMGMAYQLTINKAKEIKDGK